MNDVTKVQKRGTIRSTVAALSIPVLTVNRNFQCSEIRRHKNVMKPFFDACKYGRERKFSKAAMKNDKNTFHDMMIIIHADVKLFYLTKKSLRILFVNKS